jgi:hypothetical protein
MGTSAEPKVLCKETEINKQHNEILTDSSSSSLVYIKLIETYLMVYLLSVHILFYKRKYLSHVVVHA